MTIRNEIPVNPQHLFAASHDTRDKSAEITKPKDTTAPSGFFKLPGEIKNQIYDLVFEACDYEIKWLKCKRIVKSNHPIEPRRAVRYTRTLTHFVYKFDRRDLDQTRPWGSSKMKSSASNPLFTVPKLGRNTPRRRRLIRHPPASLLNLESNVDRARSAHTRAALLLTCRSVHNEAVSIFYSLQSFGFSSRAIFETFLSTINPVAKASITRLFLQHGTYGDPYYVENIPWKTLHDARWAKCCAMMAKDLVSLKELNLLFRINDHPQQFNLKAQWAQPLLSLCDMGLKVFELELLVQKENSRTELKLLYCARVVRMAVLGCMYDEEAEMATERKHLALQYPVQAADPVQVRPKATKILRIVW